MAAHEVGLTETEGGVMLTELDELLVIAEHLRVFAQVLPAEGVDRVGRVVAVVHALLIAQHLLAAEHERYTLRGEDSRLGEEVEADELVVGDAGDGGAQAVDEAHVVVAGDVANLLRRFIGPRLTAVVHLGHVDLRVGDGADNTELHALLLTGLSGEEGTFVVIVERTAEGVAQVIAEGADAVELRGVGLHGELLRRVGALSGAPALTIDIDGGVDLVDLVADGVHRLDVVHAHEVEAEAVDVVFVYPVFHAGEHEVAHDGLV